jgi:hypothetical protein
MVQQLAVLGKPSSHFTNHLKLTHVTQQMHKRVHDARSTQQGAWRGAAHSTRHALKPLQAQCYRCRTAQNGDSGSIYSSHHAGAATAASGHANHDTYGSIDRSPHRQADGSALLQAPYVRKPCKDTHTTAAFASMPITSPLTQHMATQHDNTWARELMRSRPPKHLTSWVSVASPGYSSKQQHRLAMSLGGSGFISLAFEPSAYMCEGLQLRHSSCCLIMHTEHWVLQTM